MRTPASRQYSLISSSMAGSARVADPGGTPDGGGGHRGGRGVQTGWRTRGGRLRRKGATGEGEGFRQGGGSGGEGHVKRREMVAAGEGVGLAEIAMRWGDALGED